LLHLQSFSNLSVISPLYMKKRKIKLAPFVNHYVSLNSFDHYSVCCAMPAMLDRTQSNSVAVTIEWQ